MDDVVVPVAQVYSGSAVPAPPLSRSTSVGFADARGSVQIADVGTGLDRAQQAGRDEAVDDDLLDSRAGLGATAEGSVGDRREEACESRGQQGIVQGDHGGAGEDSGGFEVVREGAWELRGEEVEGEEGGDGSVEGEVEAGCSSAWDDFLAMGSRRGDVNCTQTVYFSR